MSLGMSWEAIADRLGYAANTLLIHARLHGKAEAIVYSESTRNRALSADHQWLQRSLGGETEMEEATS